MTSIQKAREALDEARKFIAAEYADASAEMYGEWLASEARPVFDKICCAIADMEKEGEFGDGPYGYLLKPIGLNEEHWTLSKEPSEYPAEVVSVPLFSREPQMLGPALAALDAETPATPADVGEEPVAWANSEDLACIGGIDPSLAAATREQQSITYYGRQSKRYDVPLYSATALERVVRDRDEALIDANTQAIKRIEAEQVEAKLLSRAESAERRIADLEDQLRRVTK